MRSPAGSARSIVGIVIGAVVAAWLVAGVGAEASSSYTASSYATRLLDLVNGARQSHGLRPLALAAGTNSVAAGWTQHLADSQVLSHNPQLGHQLATHGSQSWHVYGENVGTGAADDPDGLFAAYMKSPEHRANILRRAYRYVGVGVVLAGSRSWNTFDFVDAYGEQAAAAQPVEPARAHATQHSGTTSRPVATSGSIAMAAASGQVPLHRAFRPAAHRVTAVRPAHRHAHTPSVRVEGLRAFRLHRAPDAIAVAVPAPVMAAVTGSRGPLPADRSHEIAVALAVLALAAGARRWVLVATAAA